MSGLRSRWECFGIEAISDGDGVRLVHARERAELEVRHGRLSRGRAYAEASPSVRRELARLGAILRLRQRGRYYVHAAGMVDPAGRAWLFAGSSGAGKSTLAYVLARHGWRLLGDDGVVLECTSTGVTAHPWRDALKVSRALSASFPELLELEPCADTSDPRLRVAVSIPLARRAPVAALVFVARAASDSLTRMPACSALAALIRQSPWVLVDDDDARGHLEALRRVISEVPAWRLDHTSAQLDLLPRTLAEAIA